MRKRLYQERTTTRIVLTAIAAGSVGILFLVVSSAWKPLLDSPELRSLVRDLCSLFIVSVAIAFLWELFAKRAFVAELLATTNLAEDIETTGLSGASAKWHGEIDWQWLFSSCETFELLFSYGRTWRNTNRAYLQEFAARRGTRAKIAIPDPDNRSIVEELARRFDKTPEALADSIKEAERDFVDMFNAQGRAHEKLQIWRIAVTPVWSYYRFDNLEIFQMYKHRRGRLDVPTFQAKKSGTLYDFLTTEFGALTSEETHLARKSSPPAEKPRQAA